MFTMVHAVYTASRTSMSKRKPRNSRAFWIEFPAAACFCRSARPVGCSACPDSMTGCRHRTAPMRPLTAPPAPAAKYASSSRDRRASSVSATAWPARGVPAARLPHWPTLQGRMRCPARRQITCAPATGARDFIFRVCPVCGANFVRTEEGTALFDPQRPSHPWVPLQKEPSLLTWIRQSASALYFPCAAGG